LSLYCRHGRTLLPGGQARNVHSGDGRPPERPAPENPARPSTSTSTSTSAYPKATRATTTYERYTLPAASGMLTFAVERGDLYVGHGPCAGQTANEGSATRAWIVASLTPAIVVKKANPRSIHGPPSRRPLLPHRRSSRKFHDLAAGGEALPGRVKERHDLHGLLAVHG